MSMIDSSLRSFAREAKLSVIKSVLTDEHASRLSNIVDCLQTLLRLLDTKDGTEVTMQRRQWLALLKTVTEEAAELQSEIRAGIEAC